MPEADPIVSSADWLSPQQRWCWFHLNSKGQALELGPGVEALTGLSVQECTENFQRLTDLIQESDRPAYRDHIARAQGSAAGSTLTFGLRHSASRRLLTVQEYRKPVLSPLGQLQGFQGLWIDVSRQQILENRLDHGAWKETLGVLIPGLIHEFNNTLAGILSLSDLFLGQIETTHPFHEGLSLIKQSTQKACQRLQHLHAMHRGTPGSRCFLDLNEVARETVDLLKRALRRRTELELTTAAETLPIHADPVQLQQTVIQLALNAMETMPEGGSIRFQTRLRTQLPPAAKALRLPAVTLSIEDSGPGLTSSEAHAIFDPLYTTKPDRGEAGLGLHYARRFAEAHRGTVTAQSRLGFGSVFTLWLPQADFTEAEGA